MPNNSNHIARLRKKRGISQQQLAEMIGAHYVTLSNIERGKAPLSSEWSRKIAEALKVDENALLTVERPIRALIGGELAGNRALFFPQDHNYVVAEGGSEFSRYENTSDWFVVGDDGLYPVFREGDAIRLMIIFHRQLFDREYEIQAAVGRLCVLFEMELPQVCVGHMQPGSSAQSVTIAPINGPARTYTEFESVYVIDRAMFRPVYPNGRRPTKNI